MSFPGRVFDVTHRLQEDLLERIAAMRELPDHEVLPPQQAP